MKRAGILAFCFLQLAAIASYAQWKKIADLDEPINTIYFLDHLGLPDIGFCGGQDLYRTTDRGNSWTRVMTRGGVWLTQMSFADVNNGWACFMQGGIFATSDLGVTWVRKQPNRNHTAIHAKSPQLVLASTWEGSSVMSSDGGNSWSFFAPGHQNGFAFVDNQHGLQTTLQDGFSGDPGFYYTTTDGGFTWTRHPDNGIETWQPLAIPNTSTYFASCEYSGGDRIIRSDDFGHTWRDIYYFKQPPFVSGQIAGSITNLFISTQDSGFYNSKDSGKTWTAICGPNLRFDTRFHLMGDVIYAGDASGGIWRSDSSSLDMVTEQLPDTIALSGKTCELLSDDILLFHFACGKPFYIDEIIPLDPDAVSVRVSRPTPVLVSPDMPLGMVISNDSLNIDTFQTHIAFVLRIDPVIDTILVPVRITRFGYPAVSVRNISSFTNDRCRHYDTVITMCNLVCDTIEVVSATFDDPLFGLVGPTPFPYQTPPDSCLKVNISADFPEPGIYSTKVSITYLYRGKLYDTSLSISINALRKDVSGVMLDPPVLSFGNTSLCKGKSLSVKFAHPNCSPVVVDSLSATGGPHFQLAPQVTPFTLSFDSTYSIDIQFAPKSAGPYSSLVTIYYTSKGVQFDTTVAIFGNGVESGTAELLRSTIDFPQTPACSESFETTYVQSLSCDTARVVVIKPFATAEYSLVSPVQAWVAAGDTIPVNVAFASWTAGLFTDELALEVVTVTGRRDTLTLRVSGLAVSDSLSLLHDPALYFGEVSMCGRKDTLIRVQNPSDCDSLTIVAIYFTGDADFTSDAAQMPLTLAPGEYADLNVRVIPTTGGSRTATMLLLIRNKSYSRLDTVYLSTDVIPGGKRLITNAVAVDFGTLPVCELPGSAITLTNDGCDTLTVDAADMQGSGFTIDLAIFPLELAPDSSFVVPIAAVLDTVGGKTSAAATVTFRTVDAGSPIVTLTRAWIMPRTYTIVLDTIADATAGDFVTLKLRMLGDIIDLQQVDLQLFFNTDMLEFELSANFNSVVPLPANRFIIFNAPFLMIGPDGTIAEFKFRVHLTKDSVSDMIVDEVVLNPRDSLYEACIAKAIPGSSNFNYRYSCGDRMIAEVLRTKALTIDNIIPNPTEENVVVTFTSVLAGDMQVEVFDGLGRLVGTESMTAQAGINKHEIKLPRSSSGLFTVRLRTGSHTARGRFVKQ